MQIDFNLPLTNLDGSELIMPDGSAAIASKVLANWLMNSAAKGLDIAKRYNWAMELYKTNSIDLDAAGRVEFHKFIDDIDGASVMVKGTILERLNS
jgi:hypothetical protein